MNFTKDQIPQIAAEINAAIQSRRLVESKISSGIVAAIKPSDLYISTDSNLDEAILDASLATSSDAALDTIIDATLAPGNEELKLDEAPITITPPDEIDIEVDAMIASPQPMTNKRWKTYRTSLNILTQIKTELEETLNALHKAYFEFDMGRQRKFIPDETACNYVALHIEAARSKA